MLAIEISNLYKKYPRNVQALDGLSLKIEEGSFFALLGPNGSGKSTTLGIISSLVQKTSGLVKIFGYDIDKQLSEAKNYVGLVPQEFNFFIFETLFDILVNQAGYFGVESKIAKIRAEKYLSLLGLWHKKDAKARELSGGMKRRLMIARAMMHQPKVLILDEPTASLDIEVRHQIWDFLQFINREENTTIILTTHYLEEAERLCNDVAIINNGKIITQGLMQNILASFSEQSYLAELSTPLKISPSLKGFELNLQNSTNLEINFESPYTVSNLFEQLLLHKIEVKTLNLQGNRLEELFLNLTARK
ncbi:MAG: ABC transporter ATP-binding protein [Rickettsiales bacterium]